MQTAMMARLSEDISQASVQTKEKRSSFGIGAKSLPRDFAAAIRNCQAVDSVMQAAWTPQFLIHGTCGETVKQRHAGHFSSHS